MRAATVSCGALVTVGGFIEWGLRGTGAPVIVHMTLVGAGGGIAYLIALRACFPAAWGDLAAALRRVIPARSVRFVARLVPRPLARAARL